MKDNNWNQHNFNRHNHELHGNLLKIQPCTFDTILKNNQENFFFLISKPQMKNPFFPLTTKMSANVKWHYWISTEKYPYKQWLCNIYMYSACQLSFLRQYQFECFCNISKKLSLWYLTANNVSGENCENYFIILKGKVKQQWMFHFSMIYNYRDLILINIITRQNWFNFEIWRNL